MTNKIIQQLGFKAAEFFKAGDAARTVPTVDFGT